MRTPGHPLFGFVLLCVSAFVCSATAAGQGAWHHIEAEDGIDVWKLELPGQDMPGFRGQTFIHGSVDDIMQQLLDWKQHTKWMFHCSESLLLKQVNANQAIMYNRTDAPWPIWDRDVIVDTTISVAPDKRSATVTFKNINSKLKGPVEHVVRMPRMIGFYKLWQVEPTRVKVLYQVEADIGGSIPGWLAARAAKDLPYHTLLRLRERVEGMHH
jgi:hypothetical protein